MNVNDIILIIEQFGLPTAVILIGSFLYWQSQKQSARRDGVNADLHKSYIRLQDEQNKILDKLSAKMTDGDANIELQIDKAKNELVRLITENQKVIQTNHADVVEEISKIPLLMSEAQLSYDKKIQIGLQSLILDVTKAIQRVMREEKKDEKPIAVDPS